MGSSRVISVSRGFSREDGTSYAATVCWFGNLWIVWKSSLTLSSDHKDWGREYCVSMRDTKTSTYVARFHNRVSPPRIINNWLISDHFRDCLQNATMNRKRISVNIYIRLQGNKEICLHSFPIRNKRNVAKAYLRDVKRDTYVGQFTSDRNRILFRSRQGRTFHRYAMLAMKMNPFRDN